MTSTRPPAPAGYDEYVGRLHAAEDMCPFESGTDRWHDYHSYIENAKQLDSVRHYVEYSPERIAEMAEDHANEMAGEV